MLKTRKRRTEIRDARAGEPAQLGFRMPAEWEPQAAVWLSWPHNRKTWAGHFRPIPAKFAEVAALISRFEPVRINAAGPLWARARRLIERAGGDPANIAFFPHPTDDCWCRDHGPIFVRHPRTGEVALTDWKFNAWGRKYPRYARDNGVPRRIGRALGLRRFAIPMILEGGSIDVNGAGQLLTTESCLLNRNRNPGLTRAAIEGSLRRNLGVSQILWLGAGIAGDDTDGHVDDLCRFFRADGIVASVERDPRDPNYAPLQENRRRLADLRTPDSGRFAIVELPMPQACFWRGQRLPATYANFLIINDAVLIPAFGQPHRDAEAAALLGGCFPGRRIIPIDCRDLVVGLGTLHCISQQQPA